MNEAEVKRALSMLADKYESYLRSGQEERAAEFGDICDVLAAGIAEILPERDHTRYTDCYSGCGGEDCPCCEIHVGHVNELYEPPVNAAYDMARDYSWDEYCPEDCERCGDLECRNRYVEQEQEDYDAATSYCAQSTRDDKEHEWALYRSIGWACKYCGVAMPNPRRLNLLHMRCRADTSGWTTRLRQARLNGRDWCADALYAGRSGTLLLTKSLVSELTR